MRAPDDTHTSDDDGTNDDWLARATKKDFAPSLLFRTGCWEHNVKLAMKAQKMGLKFSPHGVFRGHKRIDDNTEEGIFRALGENYVPP